jgi:hypothetical protein
MLLLVVELVICWNSKLATMVSKPEFYHNFEVEPVTQQVDVDWVAQ